MCCIVKHLLYLALVLNYSHLELLMWCVAKHFESDVSVYFESDVSSVTLRNFTKTVFETAAFLAMSTISKPY